jgi:hypothetical protein
MICSDCIFKDTPARREFCQKYCRPTAEEIVADLRRNYYDTLEMFETVVAPEHLNDWIRRKNERHI